MPARLASARPPACCRLVPPDVPAALVHYSLAASAGDPVAQMSLGYRHLQGIGVPQSCQTGACACAVGPAGRRRGAPRRAAAAVHAARSAALRVRHRRASSFSPAHCSLRHCPVCPCRCATAAEHARKSLSRPKRLQLTPATSFCACCPQPRCTTAPWPRRCLRWRRSPTACPPSTPSRWAVGLGLGLGCSMGRRGRGSAPRARVRQACHQRARARGAPGARLASNMCRPAGRALAAAGSFTQRRRNQHPWARRAPTRRSCRTSRRTPGG